MNKRKVSSIAFGLAVLISCSAQEIKPEERIQESPSSDEVLLKVDQTYKKLASYQDEGVSVTQYIPLPGNTNELHFTTVFSASGKFRFEFWQTNLVAAKREW